MFSFLDATDAKLFGIEMAQLFMKRMPVDVALKEKQFAIKSQQIIENMSLKIVEYKKEHRLNTYKIAQMCNAFQWELKDAGYNDDYVNKLTQLFVVRVRT